MNSNNVKQQELADKYSSAVNQREQVAAVCCLLLPAHAGSPLANFSTLKMEAIRSSEMSVHFTGSTRRHISEDGILHSHRCENLKSLSFNVQLSDIPKRRWDELQGNVFSSGCCYMPGTTGIPTLNCRSKSTCNWTSSWPLKGWYWVWVLCYDRRSAGQSVLE
jgi:hypothetical protein